MSLRERILRWLYQRPEIVKPPPVAQTILFPVIRDAKMIWWRDPTNAAWLRDIIKSERFQLFWAMLHETVDAPVHWPDPQRAVIDYGRLVGHREVFRAILDASRPPEPKRAEPEPTYQSDTPSLEEQLLTEAERARQERIARSQRNKQT